ncbi:MAG: hypothetical protein K5639_06190 [Eubacterium sp.]|nr:hypothetical protein [Eubacterium sp.]
MKLIRVIYMIKKPLAGAMMMVMLSIILCAPVSFAADISNYKDQPVIKGDFGYLSSISYNDKRAVFYYSDGYFSTSATDYDEHLATMSLCMAMSAMNSSEGKSDDYYNKSVNIRGLFDELGFDDISVNADFVSKPTEKSMGVAIAKKEIVIDGKEFTLIPIGVRGAGYEKEWISNMEIGSEGDAKGLSEAAEKVFAFVKAYVEKNNINTSSAKFWISGFSRAAAVTDILTKKLTDEYDSDGTRVYGYSFATPRAAYESKKKYINSHCILNPLDMVPYVVPEYLGFGHYGEEKYVPEKSGDTIPADTRFKHLDALLAHSLSEGEFVTAVLRATYAASILGIIDFPDGYEIEPTNAVTIKQDELINRVLTMIAGSLVLDRVDLTEKVIYDNTTVEDVLSTLIRFLMTISDEKKKALTEELSRIKSDKTGLQLAGISIGLNDVIDAVHDGYKNLDENRKNEMCEFLKIILEPHLKKVLSTEEYNNLNKIWRSLVYIFMELAHFDYTHSEDKGLVTIGTLMKNLALVGKNHSAELYLANMRCRDDFYEDEFEVLPAETNHAYVKIAEASYVDATVKKDGKNVSEIRNGKMYLSTDEDVEVVCTTDKKEKLKKDGTSEFYTIPSENTERQIGVGEGNYSITFSPDDTDDEKEFVKWVDENGKELSHEKEFVVNVNDSNASNTYIKPVYKTVPATPEEALTGTNNNSSSSGGLLWWLLGGVSAAAAAGGGGFIFYRKKIRKKD